MSERELLVIGGVGGSGTRLFAEAARAAGRSLDGDLNHALDNLWFTYLFKRPGGYGALDRRVDRMPTELRLLKAGLAAKAPSPIDAPFLMARTVEGAVKANNHLGAGRGKWPAARLARFLNAPRTGRAPADCFKEPNASIFLKPLSEYFPRMKYVHVARHGLDMALSDNQQMFHNWGRLFGLDPEGDASPRQILKFWVRLNDEVTAIGETLGADRFFFARYDDFVAEPRAFAECYLRFIAGDGSTADALAKIARTPSSFRRFLEVDPATFDVEDTEAVRRHGFDVPADFVAASRAA
jgi:hypothetical protein